VMNGRGPSDDDDDDDDEVDDDPSADVRRSRLCSRTNTTITLGGSFR
jgi:hypothetical protein